MIRTMNKERLKQYFAQMGIELDDKQVYAFIRYYEMLVEKNKVMNLTAITEPEDVLIKHFADSVSPGPLNGRLIDVGTGAGFPGIPLKIAFPDLQVTLLDSLKKRVTFLDEVISELKLSGISTFHGRAEDLARDPGHREKYDLVVSRAVAHMSILSEYCLPFLKCDGRFIAYKSKKYLEENEASQSETAVKLLGGKTEEIRPISLPECGADRCLVIIKKISHTPKQYPQKAGMAKRMPIGSPLK